MRIAGGKSWSRLLQGLLRFNRSGALVCLLLFYPAWVTAAPEPGPVPEEDQIPEVIEEAIEPFPHAREEPESRLEESPAGVDDCGMQGEDLPIQETSQEAVRSISCYTFRWFDSWWGDEKDYPEDQVSGWLTLGAAYRKYDGFDPRMRFRVSAPLPNLDNRWKIIVGRVDEEAYISDTEAQDRTFYNPGLLPEEDAEWLLGLGKRRRNRKQGLDWSVGVRLRFPPEPYVKTSYFWNRRTGENSDFRFRQTVFWRSDEGFGTTSRGDHSWGVNDRNVLRWEGRVTVSEESEGARWYAGQTWYHLLGDRNALSVLVFGKGESEREVPIRDYGVEMVWRKSFTRDWMYLSMGPSITWPRKKIEDKRELNLGFGVWLEMEFGDWRY